MPGDAVTSKRGKPTKNDRNSEIVLQSREKETRNSEIKIA